MFAAKTTRNALLNQPSLPKMDRVGAPISLQASLGGSISFNFMASPGADVFIDVTGNNAVPSYRGVGMTLVYDHPNFNFNRYRYAGGGTGKTGTFTISVGVSQYATAIFYSVSGVSAVSDVQYNSGNGASQSQTVTASEGLVIQGFTMGVNNASWTSASGGTLTAAIGPAAYGSAIASNARGSLGDVTFTATTSVGSGWGGMAHILT